MKHETLLVILASSLLLATSMAPFFVQAWNTPPDRVFAGTHKWSEDYTGYLSTIKQGMEGRLTALVSYTSEPHTGQLVHTEYLLLGHLGRIFHLDVVLTYHLSRLVLGAGLLATTYFFLLRFLKDRKLVLLAFFLSFFSAGLPKLTWLTEIDILRRPTILPYYLLGNVLFLLTFLLVYEAWEKKSLKLAVAAGISGFFLGWIHPIHLLVLYFTLVLFLFLKFILKPELSTINYQQSTIFFVLSAFPLLYYHSLWQHPFWYLIQSQGAVTVYNIPTWDLVLALGPVVFLAFLGIWRIWGKDRSKALWLVSYLLVLLICFYWLYGPLDINRIRFLQGPWYVPLGILAAYGLTKFKIPDSSFQMPNSILALVLLISLPTFYASLRSQIYEFSDFKTFSTLIYPTKKQFEGFKFLEQNTDSDEIVLSLYEAGNLIPAFSGNTVFLGHTVNTIDFKKKEIVANRFFSGLMSEKEAREFLGQERISYIFYGFQEKSLGGNFGRYDFLHPVFENEKITIFKAGP